MATQCCVEKKKERSCIRVQTDEHSFGSICPVSGSSLQLVEFKREDHWLSRPLVLGKSSQKAATKARSYLMSSAVAKHRIRSPSFRRSGRKTSEATEKQTTDLRISQLTAPSQSGPGTKRSDDHTKFLQHRIVHMVRQVTSASGHRSGDVAQHTCCSCFPMASSFNHHGDEGDPLRGTSLRSLEMAFLLSGIGLCCSTSPAASHSKGVLPLVRRNGEIKCSRAPSEGWQKDIRRTAT